MVKTAMQRAIENAVQNEGSRARVAGRLGITRQAMDQWDKVPAKHVLVMEILSGVSRYELRPDIYGKPPKETRGRPKTGVQRAQAAA